jgi:hypothetical protein
MMIKRAVFILLASALLFYQAELTHSQLSKTSKNKSTTDTTQQNSTQNSSDTSENDNKADSTQEPEVTVTAYYFHRSHRCRTCLAIERNAHDAIKWYYSKELERGKLRFIPLDMEDSENQHFVKDYQLYTSSLVLVKSRNGKQEKWENLQEVWLLVRDMEKFYKYVKENVDRFLEVAK